MRGRRCSVRDKVQGFQSNPYLSQMRSLLFLLALLISISVAAQTPRVLIIGIDGCRPDALEFANTPNIDQLVANGYYSPDALNDDITISGPGWSGILTGARSNKHGVTDNSFNGSNYAQYPSIFSRLEGIDPNYNTGSIVHWGPINSQIEAGGADYSAIHGTDQAVANDAVNYLNNNNPDLLFLHFDQVDHAGHASGFSTGVPAYVTAIENVDVLVGQVMTAVNNRPNATNEEWLILVTPDHGGLGFSHGGTSIDEQLVFFIASGDDVPNEVVRSVETVTPPAADCLNETFELAFDGTDDRVIIPEAAVHNFGANQDFTVELRVKTGQAADVSIIGDKDWNSGANPGFVFSFRFNSGPEWKVNVGDGSNRADLNVPGAIADEEWHHLAVSFDRDGLMRAYEDGQFIASGSMANVGNINTAGGLFLGADVNTAFEFSGAISEVRFWDGLLPSGSITDWQCKRLTTSHPQYANLIGYWPLDENNGLVAIDGSAGGNNGNISGAVWQPQPATVTHDYSGTPRLEDIPITALEHLCISKDPAWNLDGISRIASCQSLPVNWRSLMAERDPTGKVAVSWTTEQELNNGGFQVERTEGRGSWLSVSPVVPPHSNGRYSFTDATAPKDRELFYRIRQFDHDGTSNLSRVRSVNAIAVSSNWRLYPNPVDNQLQVDVSAEDAGQSWRIIDSKGAEVATGKFTGSGANFIATDRLAAGVYNLWIGGVTSRFVVR